MSAKEYYNPLDHMYSSTGEKGILPVYPQHDITTIVTGTAGDTFDLEVVLNSSLSAHS